MRAIILALLPLTAFADCETPEFFLTDVPARVEGATLEGQFDVNGFIVQAWRSPSEPINDMWIAFQETPEGWCAAQVITADRRLTERRLNESSVELPAWGD